MTTTARLIIMCPVCGASGAMLHHDIRSALVYSCLNCTHEWQIDPAVGAAATDPTVIEQPKMSSSVCSKDVGKAV